MIIIVICCYRCWMLIVISSINMPLAYIYIYTYCISVLYLLCLLCLLWLLMLLSSLLLHIHSMKYDIYRWKWNGFPRHAATTRRVQRSSPSDERSAAECHRSAPMLVVSVEPAGAGRTGEQNPLILRDSPVFCKEHDATKELHTLFQTVTRIESHDFDSCHDQTMSLIKWWHSWRNNLILTPVPHGNRF